MSFSWNNNAGGDGTHYKHKEACMQHAQICTSLFLYRNPVNLTWLRAESATHFWDLASKTLH